MIAQAKFHHRRKPTFTRSMTHEEIVTLLRHVRSQSEERYLIYASLFYTGLRTGELAAVKAEGMECLHEVPHIHLPSAATKHLKEKRLPIALPLLDPLMLWCAEQGLQYGSPLFEIPCHLPRLLRRDLQGAGIPIVDENETILDMRTFRATHASLLQGAGADILDVFLWMDIPFEDNIGQGNKFEQHAETLNRFPDFLKPTELPQQ